MMYGLPYNSYTMAKPGHSASSACDNDGMTLALLRCYFETAFRGMRLKIRWMPVESGSC